MYGQFEQFSEEAKCQRLETIKLTQIYKKILSGSLIKIYLN